MITVRLTNLLIVLFILLSLVPAYYANVWLQRFLQPRSAFFRFVLYTLICFALVFVYSFFITLALLKLFPPPR